MEQKWSITSGNGFIPGFGRSNQGSHRWKGCGISRTNSDSQLSGHDVFYNVPEKKPVPIPPAKETNVIKILQKDKTNEISIKTGSQEIWFNLDKESSIELYLKLGKVIHGTQVDDQSTVSSFYGGYNLLD